MEIEVGSLLPFNPADLGLSISERKAFLPIVRDCHVSWAHAQSNPGGLLTSCCTGSFKSWKSPLPIYLLLVLAGFPDGTDADEMSDIYDKCAYSLLCSSNDEVGDMIAGIAV